MSSNFDSTHLHTIRLTGHWMSELKRAKQQLWNQLQEEDEHTLPPGTILQKTFNPQIFYLTPSTSSTLTLKEPLSCLDLSSTTIEQVRNSMCEFFQFHYHYKNFTYDDLHLLMKESGINGYLVNGEIDYLVWLTKK